MTINAITIKLFGKKATLFQVIENNEVVQVCESRAEAESWISNQ